MPEPTTVAAAFVQTLAPDQYQAYTDRIADREMTATRTTHTALRNLIGEALVAAGGQPGTFPVVVNAQAGVLADAVLTALPELLAAHARQLAAMPQDPAPAPAPAAGLTVYELRVGTDDDPRPEVIARYATHTAAALHGEAEYRAAHGTAAYLEWPQTGTDQAPRYRLQAVDDLDGDEVETDWHIVPTVVPATYTPAGGAR